MTLKPCVKFNHKTLSSEGPFECDFPIKLRLHITGNETKNLQLDKSSYGNIETIHKVFTKSITKAMLEKDTIFNF